MSEIERLRRDCSLVDTAASFGLALAKDGDEHIACCPFHAEDTPSFTIFTGKDHVERFFCFGCGEKGDVVDFVKGVKGVDTREAIKILGGKASSRPNIEPRRVEVRDVYAGIVPIEPPAAPLKAGSRIKLYNPKRKGTEREWGSFVPSMVFPYRALDGALVGYVLRHDLPDGGKETPMVMAVRLPGGERCWCRYPFPKPRLLYGLDQIPDGRQVIVVEGEKCRDVLHWATGRGVVSWPGGTQGVKHCDWSPLYGRDVLIWPDSDLPGRSAMDEIAGILSASGSRVRWFDVGFDEAASGPYSFGAWRSGCLPPKGWDCADAVADQWSRDQIEALMRATVREWARATPEAIRDEPAPLPAPTTSQDPPSPMVEARTVYQVPPDEEPADGKVVDMRSRLSIVAERDWRGGLIHDDDGNLAKTKQHNWALFMMNHPELCGAFAFDAFKRVPILRRQPPWHSYRDFQSRRVQDGDYAEAAMWLERQGMSPAASKVTPIVLAIAERNAFDPLLDYLDGLEWDRKPRVDQWMTYYLGVDPSEYVSAVARKTLVASVARALRPGCKVDTMPILEGDQGLGKSEALRALYGGEFFADEISDLTSKDASQEMQGVWCIEMSEMHRVSSAGADAVKKFLSRRVDRYRPPYGRSVIEAPRRAVFAGTINPDGNPYLRDSTGARRFWPVMVSAVDTDGIETDRDQLWAEALHMLKNGESWWFGRDEVGEAISEQAKRMNVDVWADVLSAALLSRSKVTLRDLLEILEIAPRNASDQHAARIGRVMAFLGWSMGQDGERRVYVKPGAKVSMADDPAGW